MRPAKILLVVTGVDTFADGKLPTGLWLSEFTHIFHRAKQCGFRVTIANPRGGATPVDPESLKPLVLDRLSRAYWQTPGFREMLDGAHSLEEVSEERFDCIYLAGGHGAMYDFPDNAVLQRMIQTQYESGRLVAAICHGVCGLLDVKLADGRYLIRCKRLTGFSWFEESLAHRKKAVPFNLEAAFKARGACYEKALIPLFPKVVVDGNLITGQDPFSSGRLARVVMRRLEKIKNVR